MESSKQKAHHQYLQVKNGIHLTLWWIRTNSKQSILTLELDPNLGPG